jgi:hypothetical protein
MISIFTATLFSLILAVPTIAPEECEGSFRPVCNTSGIVFSEECQILKLGGTLFPRKCVPRGQACPNYFMPVCGADGNRYSNDCDLLAADTVASSEYIFSGPEQKCVKRICAAFWMPLCDDQGNIYENECQVSDAGAEISTTLIYDNGVCVPTQEQN